MTFLKKLGMVLQKATQILTGLGPLVPGYAGPIQRAKDTLVGIAAIVVNAEAMGQALALPGDQKLKAAAPLVAQIILQSDVMLDANSSPRKIDNPELFKAGAEKIASGMADVLNSLKDDLD